MTRPERGREGDLEARWAAAGASADERAAVARSAAAEQAADQARRRVVGTWRSARLRAEALRRERSARRRIALGGALAGASAMAAVLFALYGGAGAPHAADAVAAVSSAGVEAHLAARVERAEASSAEPRTELGAALAAGHPGDAPRPALEGLAARGRARVPAWAEPERRLLPGGLVELARGTALLPLAPKVFRLDERSVRVSFAAVEGAAPVRVQAGDLVLESLGAVFAARVEDGRGSVRVFEGAVRVRAGASAARVVDAAAGVVPASEPWTEAETAVHAAFVAATAARAARVAAAAGAPPRTLRTTPADRPEAHAAGKEEVGAYRAALERLRGGDPRGASSAFSDYLARFPEGALREEAELSRLEALATAGDLAALAREAGRWLTAHPAHPRAREVRALIGGE